MKLISFLLRVSPKLVLAAILVGLVAGATNTGLLAVINAALNSPGSSSGTLVWGFAGLCLVMLLSRISSAIMLIRLSRWAVYDLRIMLSRRILGAPLRHLEELGASRLLATLTDDVPAVANALVTIPLLCMNFAIVATCLIYLGWLSWQVFLIVVGFMVFGVITYQLPIKRALRYVNITRQEWDALFKHFKALTEGMKELKLHSNRRDAFFSDQLEPTANSLRRHGFTGDSIYAISAGWGQVLIFILIGFLLFLIPGWQRVDAQTLVGYSLVILYLMTPLELIVNTLPILGRANVAMQKVEDLGLSLQSSTVEASTSTPAQDTTRFEKLELADVTHTYYREGSDGNFLLGPVNLEFHPGEVVFLVGGNGSGKTTLAKLLTGLYIPESGEIRLDGQVITDQNRESYRQLFSVVFSDFYLFDNLLGLSAPELDKQAGEYLKLLQLEHKIEVKDGALSTTKLSQGQRKRLALMTAYLEDRPFYLFDEWAADQDPLFKNVFYMQLLPELKAKGKMVLVISHDDHYYHMADYIIKLDYGKVEYNKHTNSSAQVLAETQLKVRARP